ncbi:unnamed protein product [Angiostrongylus costaricensis]|uniref:DNA polymerase n=1 Tax=Angiostrongylus costaricensis TaxID=334426 RepID=A0A158PIQ7_ANGCS|nr:unnamed protein product [Angiostrongylus costaricensis]
MTSCAIECDAVVSDIMNKKLHSANVHSCNPGLEYIWREEVARCAAQGRKLEDTFNNCKLLDQSSVSKSSHLRYDPDILFGYDTSRLSWGYVLKRASVIGCVNFHQSISRYTRVMLLTFFYFSFISAYDKATTTLNILKKKLPILDDRSLYILGTLVLSKTYFAKYVNKLSLLNISLLSEINWFLKTAEMARVYGIQFYEFRGSQLRVESMMFRLAHTQHYFLPSVTPSQRMKMQAPEQLQLIMEPLSAVYFDPVIVLDFQSLYPSMVIAYNYCFSTLFGKRLKRILDARQLALKLIANVTYGYTSANFSGRMPCVEVADAILGKGRETLERAISLVNRGDYSGARVIYGDTDSMFVLAPGATKDQAFSIGRRIAADVTNDNPAPVVLKLEKVYVGCVLETKKRYAGWMYENEEDDIGQLDAKGIETIRRDTCLIVAKVLERSLKLIFTRNWRALGVYLNTKLSRLNELPYTDFVFSKEFRGQYAENAHVPQLKVALSLAANNPSHIALVGERLPYIVTDGPPNATVISCVRSLQEFLADSSLQIHFIYYVHVHILPALRRVTDLLQLKIRWHLEGRSLCFTPGCSTLGSDPWCSSCIDDQSTLQFALCSLAREDRLRAICRLACAHCQKNPLCHMDRCVNHQCVWNSLARSKTARAVSKHKLYLQA